MDSRNAPLQAASEGRPQEGFKAGQDDLDFLTELDDLLSTVFNPDADLSADTAIYESSHSEDHYTEELQGIFRLAVKDHLRPVVTYISYILNERNQRQACAGLVNLLPGLSEAAREVTMEEFAEVLERIYALVLPSFLDYGTLLDSKALKELALNLSCIPALLDLRQGDSLYQAMSVDPEFEQLSHILYSIESLNSDTIDALFKAGLTTPTSLLSNRKSEISDVTGIDAQQVAVIVNAVKESDVGQAILADHRRRQKDLSAKQLKDLEVRLTKALRIREKIIQKLQQQKTLLDSIQRENTKLEAYLLSVSEKLKQLHLDEEDFSETVAEEDPETQQLKIRVRSIRFQIEQLTRRETSRTGNRTILMNKIGRLQQRYRKFVDAEERMMSDLQQNSERLQHLRRSISEMKRDILTQQNTSQESSS